MTLSFQYLFGHTKAICEKRNMKLQKNEKRKFIVPTPYCPLEKDFKKWGCSSKNSYFS